MPEELSKQERTPHKLFEAGRFLLNIFVNYFFQCYRRKNVPCQYLWHLLCVHSLKSNPTQCKPNQIQHHITRLGVGLGSQIGVRSSFEKIIIIYAEVADLSVIHELYRQINHHLYLFRSYRQYKDDYDVFCSLRYLIINIPKF